MMLLQIELLLEFSRTIPSSPLTKMFPMIEPAVDLTKTPTELSINSKPRKVILLDPTTKAPCTFFRNDPFSTTTFVEFTTAT